jgi:hypothetical protein
VAERAAGAADDRGAVVNLYSCPSCGAPVVDSHFDACYCTPRGRALIEGRSAAEYRGPFLCTSCGASLAWAAQVCRCGAPAGSSQRDRPMPRPTLDGIEALATIRRRFPAP